MRSTSEASFSGKLPQKLEVLLFGQCGHVVRILGTRSPFPFPLWKDKPTLLKTSKSGYWHIVTLLEVGRMYCNYAYTIDLFLSLVALELGWALSLPALPSVYYRRGPGCRLERHPLFVVWSLYIYHTCGIPLEAGNQWNGHHYSSDLHLLVLCQSAVLLQCGHGRLVAGHRHCSECLCYFHDVHLISCSCNNAKGQLVGWDHWSNDVCTVIFSF